MSFPELTPYVRYSKLTGYTIGQAPITSEGVKFVPLAVMAQASVTNTRNSSTTDPDTGDTVSVNRRNNNAVFCCASVFLAIKLNDYVGGFIQWPYDNLATTANGTLGGHSGVDNEKLLFEQGVPDCGITACAGCHGANAEGIGEFRRLAGQHAKYVLSQLNYIQSLVRKAPVMHGIVKESHAGGNAGLGGLPAIEIAGSLPRAEAEHCPEHRADGHAAAAARDPLRPSQPTWFLGMPKAPWRHAPAVPSEPRKFSSAPCKERRG